jgi:pimeloyl-ACP methyl ester carboxylesterase
MPPDTRYARNGDVTIAYQMMGAGPPDLVLVQGYVSNIEVGWEEPNLEARKDDVRAVMDVVGSERATLFGVSEGAPMRGLFAATYPDRTLVAGAGLHFADRGSRSLKGVPGEWRLFVAAR